MASALRLPVIRLFEVTGRPYDDPAGGWSTGIRCPRCQAREVVYNGNYFCSGFEEGTCRWVLPEDDPHYADLEPALIETQTRPEDQLTSDERAVYQSLVDCGFSREEALAAALVGVGIDEVVRRRA